MNTAQIQMQQRLLQEGLIGKPADKIINRPGSEVWRHAGNPTAMFQCLAENFHWFGRSGNPIWQWLANSGGNRTGKELVSGNVNETNCGGFNQSVRWVAEHVCGIRGSTGSFTAANEYFITRSNCVVFDRAWAGSVRTLTHDFAQIKAFFFMGHSWSAFSGLMYDATTNVMGFAQKSDLYWCELQITMNSNRNRSQGRVFMVNRQVHLPHLPIPGPPPYVCVSVRALKNFRHLLPGILTSPGAVFTTQAFVNTLPDTVGNGGWEPFVLVSREHLPVEFRQAVGPL